MKANKRRNGNIDAHTAGKRECLHTVLVLHEPNEYFLHPFDHIILVVVLFKLQSYQDAAIKTESWHLVCNIESFVLF